MILTKEFQRYIKIVNNPIFSIPFFERLGWNKDDANREAEIVYDFLKQFSFTSKDFFLNVQSTLNEEELKKGEVKRFYLKQSNNEFDYRIQGTVASNSLSVTVRNRKIPFWSFFEKKLRNSFLYYFLFDIDFFIFDKKDDLLILGNSICSVLNINKVYLKHAPITEDNESAYQSEINDAVKERLNKTKQVIESIKEELNPKEISY